MITTSLKHRQSANPFISPTGLTAAADHWDLNTPLFRYAPPPGVTEAQVERCIADAAARRRGILSRPEVMHALNHLHMLRSMCWDYFESVANTAADRDNRAEGAQPLTRELRRVIAKEAELNRQARVEKAAGSYAVLAERFEDKYHLTFDALRNGIRWEIRQREGADAWYTNLLSAVAQAMTVYTVQQRWTRHCMEVVRRNGATISALESGSRTLDAAVLWVRSLGGDRIFATKTGRSIADELYAIVLDECEGRAAHTDQPGKKNKIVKNRH